MFKSLFKSRNKSSRAKAFRRRRLFESLESRRVFAADNAAVNMFVNFDPFGGSAEGLYVAGDTVSISAGLTITSMSDVTVKVTLYEDTPNGDGEFQTFEQTVDLFDNEFVAETGAAIDVLTEVIPGLTGEMEEVADHFFDFSVQVPNSGNWWVVITAVDQDGNSALDHNGGRLEVYGSIAVTPTIDVEGLLIPGQPIDVVGTLEGGDTLLFTSAMSVYLDADSNGSYETLVATQTEADLVAQTQISFTPATTGNYQVVFDAAFGSQTGSTTAEFAVTNQHLGEDGVLSIGLDADGSNVVLTSNPAGATSIVVYGQGGNDIVLIAPNVSIPVTVFGGAGNDLIAGGSGSDILVGGDGSDIISGGAGRDLMIGGDGGDLMLGNSDDDLLISGYTSLSAAELASVLAIWAGPDTFAQRVAALQAGYLFNNAANPADNNVFDDDDIDILNGNQGTDWIFANLARDGNSDRRDVVADLSSTERAVYGELINEVP